MDLNELLRAHQGEAMKASAAKDEEERNPHLDQVALYAEQIRAVRDAGYAASPLPPVSPDQADCDAGASETALAKANSHASWDNEGGAIAPPVAPLSDNAPLKIPASYFVGAEQYSDLTLAVEAHAKQKLSRDHQQGSTP